MNLKNCEKCGKLFNYIGRDFCPDCWEQEEALFDQVRAYIQKNPGCNLTEVGEKTGISAYKILSFLREGKLVGGAGNIDMELQCVSCGKKISAGRLCEKCAEQLGKEVSQVTKPSQKKTDNPDRHRMHSREE